MSTPIYGTTADSDIAYLPPGVCGEHGPYRDPEHAALELTVGDECVGLIEDDGTGFRSLRVLLVDALRSMGEHYQGPAEHLARARWEREHPRVPWAEVSAIVGSSACGVAHRDLDHAAEYASHDQQQRRNRARVEVVVVNTPDDGPRVHVWLDGVGLTVSPRGDAIVDVIDPGRRWTRAQWADARTDALALLCPAAATRATAEYDSWADSSFITEDEDAAIEGRW